jgi:hypothetical protein
MEHDLTLTREGEFEAYITGLNHCGIKKHESVSFKYWVRCVCTPHLDARGFLFDQLTVHREFENLGSTRISCERLAMEMCDRVLEAIRVENKRCAVKSIDVEVSPEPFAATMTYSRVFPAKKKRRRRKAA